MLTKYFYIVELVVRVSFFKNSLNANEFFNNIINKIHSTHLELNWNWGTSMSDHTATNKSDLHNIKEKIPDKNSVEIYYLTLF